MAVAYNNAQLERDFEKVYPQYRSRLPIQIDDRTTLVDLSYRGHVFRLRHLVESDNTRAMAIAIGEQKRKTTLAKVCADEDMLATMKRGAIYEYQYLDRQSRLLGSFDIRHADCDDATAADARRVERRRGLVNGSFPGKKRAIDRILAIR